jgi:RHS repeat-associated protein
LGKSLPITASFAGDTFEKPSQTQVNLLLYVPEAFVIWGGNSGGLHLNQPVNFWGGQWDKQVTGGDYKKNSNFKGYADSLTAFALCEATAQTSGTPLLDQACWTAKTGQSYPPASPLPQHIGVLVSTSIVAGTSTIYGNVSALVVVNVSPNPAYAADPGKPGYGTIEAVISDPQSIVTAGPPSGTATPQITTPQQRFFLYTPELHLLAETELTTGSTPAILYEYVWFNGYPVAQIDGGTAFHWTFTDHLGTPTIQTDSSGTQYWRAEYEPFGAVFQLRTADQHQSLRLPGQEAEQFNLGSNGLTTKSYNVFRWYQPWWGRYAEADPLLSGRELSSAVFQARPDFIFSYSSNRPLIAMDPDGLTIRQCFRPFRRKGARLASYLLAAPLWALQPPVPGVAWCPQHEYLYNTIPKEARTTVTIFQSLSAVAYSRWHHLLQAQIGTTTS